MTDHQHTPQFNPDTFKWGCSDCGSFIDAADVPQGGFSGPAVEAAQAETVNHEYEVIVVVQLKTNVVFDAPPNVTIRDEDVIEAAIESIPESVYRALQAEGFEVTPLREVSEAETFVPPLGRKLGLFQGNATDASGPKPTVPQPAWDLAAWRAVENRRKAASHLALAEKDEAFIARFDPAPTDPNQKD